MNAGLVRDIFISHASEDKEEVARPLHDALVERGWSVWLDELALTIGDSLEESINAGLAMSRFGVVVFSPAFFAKRWTKRELNGLAAKEVGSGTKVILPVWHRVDQAEVLRHYPIIADRLGAPTARGIDYVADEVSRALRVAASRPANTAGSEELVQSVPLADVIDGSDSGNGGIEFSRASVANAKQGWGRWLEELLNVSEGSYEVTSARVRWTLESADGRDALCERTSNWRFLRDDIRTVFDSYWGPGAQRDEYTCTPGTPIEHFEMGGRVYVAVALPSPVGVGDTMRFASKRRVRNAFPQAHEWIEVQNQYAAGPTTLEIAFPQARPPRDAELLVGESGERVALSPEPEVDGRVVLRIPEREYGDGLLRVTWSW